MREGDRKSGGVEVEGGGGEKRGAAHIKRCVVGGGNKHKCEISHVQDDKRGCCFFSPPRQPHRWRREIEISCVHCFKCKEVEVRCCRALGDADFNTNHQGRHQEN